MASIGDILDEFFSPFSKERLWIMPETDQYTKIVRQWHAVIGALTRTKRDLAANCTYWKAHFMTNPAWKPTMTDTPKPNAFREFVPSPAGTDAATCQEAFVIYVASKATSLPGMPITIPEIQTRNLYTCSIGSFNIYTTVDQVDCASKRAKINLWMYNSMSKTSFGRFAKHPAFKLSRMATQYMWWNWSEFIDWSTGAVVTLPSEPNKSKW